MTARVVVDNTKLEQTKEKVSDVFLVTKEFQTSTEFSQFIEKSAFNAGTACMDMIVDYCIKKEIEIESISKFLTANLKAKIKLGPKKKGDVISSRSSTKKLYRNINYKPNTKINIGLKKFIKWFKEYKN